MKKKALIIGCGGMDGSHLVDILLEKNYDVHGVYRRSSYDNLSRISHARDRITLHRGDLYDGGSIDRIIREVNPDEIYNEADQDHVGFSRETPEVSIDVTTGSVQRLLETVLRFNPKIKVFQPVSATMFASSDKPLNENSPFAPASPYACAKLAAYYLCQHYRREHGLFVSCGIMFNHESPRRGPDYLLQRIIRQARQVQSREIDVISLSNMDMEVDIGYAPDYMDAAHKIVQLSTADDFVVGTGYSSKIWQMCLWALELVGVKGQLGSYLKQNNDPTFANQSILIADISKLRLATNWQPIHYRKGLVKELVEWSPQ